MGGAGPAPSTRSHARRPERQPRWPTTRARAPDGASDGGDHRATGPAPGSPCPNLLPSALSSRLPAAGEGEPSAAAPVVPGGGGALAGHGTGAGAELCGSSSSRRAEAPFRPARRPPGGEGALSPRGRGACLGQRGSLPRKRGPGISPAGDHSSHPSPEECDLPRGAHGHTCPHGSVPPPQSSLERAMTGIGSRPEPAAHRQQPAA